MDGLFLSFVLTLILLLTLTEVSGSMWKFKDAQRGSYGTHGDFGRYGGYGGFRGDSGYTSGWSGNGANSGWSGNGANSGWSNWGESGYNKGGNSRQCYDSRQCRIGECCRNRGYGGRCEYAGYGGCNDRWQKPVYPPNHKGGGQPPINTGRGGFCPPQPQWQTRRPIQLCRYDGDCPLMRKCCSSYKNRICMDPIYPSP